MSKLCIVHGDTVTFLPNFINRVIVPVPTTINGTGMATIGGKKICIAGDEKKIIQSGVVYTSPTTGHTTPGTGMINEVTLQPDQQLIYGKAGAAIIVQGIQFMCFFTPTSPAMIPGAPPVPDTTVGVKTQGFGIFTATQFFTMGA